MTAPARSSTDPQILCPLLIGREAELDQLTALLQETRGGHGRTVLVSGEAGVGKSALIRDFIRRGRGLGVRAFTGECTEIDARRPFGPFMDVARAADRLTSLPVPPPDSAAGADRYRLHAFFASLLADLAHERPVIVVVEDLHWADEASLELFPYLARKLRGVPLLLIGTYRSDELHRRHPLRPVLAELGSRRLAVDVPLHRLSEEQVTDFLRAALHLERTPTPELRHAIFETCEGNPLFMEEVLRALAERGDVAYRGGSWQQTKAVGDIAIPETLRDAVLERFTTLTVETQDLLRYAAVIGQDFDFDLLLRVTGSEDAGLVRALKSSIDAQLIVENAIDEGLERYSFRHALTRESILLDLLQRERRRMHARVGEAIESRAGPDAAAHAEELAYHFDGARDRTRAFHYHDIAARDAFRLFAFARAAHHFERAVELAEDDEPTLGELQLRAAAAAHLGATPRRALRAAEEARRWFEAAGDRRGAGVALCRIASYRWFTGEASSAREAAEEAVCVLEPLGESGELADAYSAVAMLAYLDLDASTATVRGRQAVDMARATKDVDTEVHSLITLGAAAGQLGRTEGVELLREGIALAVEHDFVNLALRGFHNLAIALAATGLSAADVRTEQETMLAYARRHGVRTDMVIVDEAFQIFPTGDWDAVLGLVHEARGELIFVAQLQLLEAFVEMGRHGPERSRRLLDAPRRGLRDAVVSHRLFGVSLLAQVTLLAGDARATLELADEIADEARRGLFSSSEVDMVAVCAIVAAIAEQDDLARDRWFAIALANEGSARRTSARGTRAFAQAERAAAEGKIDEAIAVLAGCVESFGEALVRFGETLARRRRIELLLRRNGAGDREAATAELDAILRYWRTAKAAWYLGEIERWATDRGLTFAADAAAKVTSRDTDAHSVLTPREREVAALVARGLSNKQIGETLVISERTAEGHVERILGKLGYRSRAQIASWQVGGDPVSPASSPR